MASLSYIQTVHRPRTIAEALRLTQRDKGRSRFLAGGSDLILEANESVASLIDITNLNLKYIREGKRHYRIGAATTIAELGESQLVQILGGGFLAKAALGWGSIQISNTATVGGNLVSACPTADLATPLLALQTMVRCQSGSGQHVVPLETLWRPSRKMNTGQDLITELLIPRAPRAKQLLGSFQKLTTIGSYMAVATVGIVVQLDDKGHCRKASVALGCAGQKPVRLPTAERLLVGRLLSQEIIISVSAQVAEDSPLPTDHRASDEYRRVVARHLTKKALAEIASRSDSPS